MKRIIPFTTNCPCIYGVDWTVESVVRRINRHENNNSRSCRDSIRLNNRLKDRWDIKKKSLLIESLILGIPIQQIMLVLAYDDIYDILDGQQRLLTITQFYEGKFALDGLTINPGLNCMKYADLGQDYASPELDNQYLRINLITGYHNQEILNEIRHRIM